MKSGLSIGHTAELHWSVRPEDTIALSDGQTGGAVFATPAMVNLMEYTARAALKPFLDDGEESVGVRVDVEHLAATPLGAAVRGVARVTAIDGRLVDFEVTAFDAAEAIGRGTHRRAVIRVERFADRLASKTATLAQSNSPPDERRMSALASLTPITGPPPRLATISIAASGAVATITMQRPDKLNAVNQAMTADWEQALAWLAGSADIRVVILTGAGRAFCTGDDVLEVGMLEMAAARQLSWRQARVYLALEELPQVFIAAVNGPALGAGCVCAYSCDFRIASHAAEFGMPEILLGWPPGYGVAQLTALVGKARAMELCLLGKPISARAALDIGLVHQVVPQGRLMSAAQSLAGELLARSPAALAETKRLIHGDEGLVPKTAYLADTEAYIRCLAGPDAREGIAAFRDKRPSRFGV